MFCANNASNVAYQLHVFAVIINNLKTVARITYTVLVETLNPAQSMLSQSTT